MALSDWQATIYVATADPGAGTPYDTLATSTISGYAGYTTTAIFILKPQATWNMDTAIVSDVSGTQFGKAQRRRVFNVESYPFRYDAGGTQDLDDVDTFANLIDGAAYMWLRITGGTRTWPSTSATAHPVICTGWSEQINAQAGTRTLNVTFEHRYRT